jgi:hypothetical protein
MKSRTEITNMIRIIDASLRAARMNMTSPVGHYVIPADCSTGTIDLNRPTA